ncbi:DUF4747 family protein [Hafnia paralvei]|uniref:DUF4747 family protein n=1 Tax=Hafnia paralvei TaxID=546367 RepID=UPI003CF3BB95
MAIYKFYNIQVLPLDTTSNKNIGEGGYVKVFERLSREAKKARTGKRLTSMASKLKGQMYFCPFEITVRKNIDMNIIYGTFLKFDNVDSLVDTESGDLIVKTKGNSSSKRYEFSFIFDPKLHIMAINDIAGLPTRAPLIKALEDIIELGLDEEFSEYTLSIHELTSAESLKELLDTPKDGYRKFSAEVSFSNSEKFDRQTEREIASFEGDLKKNNVHSVESTYKSDKGSLMPDLPRSAKILAWLATKFGNVDITYKKDGEVTTFHMEDYPVRLKTVKDPVGRLDKAIEVKGLIKRASDLTKK